MTFSWRKEGQRYIIVGDTRRVVGKGMMSRSMGLTFDWDTKYWWTQSKQKVEHTVVVLNKRAAQRGDQAQSMATLRGLGHKVPGEQCLPSEAKASKGTWDKVNRCWWFETAEAMQRVTA